MHRRAIRYLLACLCAIALLFVGSVGLKIYGEFRDRNYFPEKDIDEVRLAARDQKKLVVAFFTTEWCGPCKVMKQDTWRDPGVRKWLDDEALTVMVDCDRSNDVCTNYDIRGYPTTILFGRNGKEVSRITGGREAEKFLAIMRDVLSDGVKAVRTLEMMDGWRTDGVEWKVVHDFGVAAIDFRGAVTNAGV